MKTTALTLSLLLLISFSAPAYAGWKTKVAGVGVALAVKAAVRGSMKAHSGKFLTAIGKKAYEKSYDKVLKYTRSHRQVSYDKISKIVNDYVTKKPKYKPHAEKFLADLSAALGRINLKYWKRADVAGKRVYQRNDLFKASSDNINLMKKGLAPKDSNGTPIELHHILQRNTDSLVEITKKMHVKNTKIIHINNGSGIKSGINRVEFRGWKKKYWKERGRVK